MPFTVPVAVNYPSPLVAVPSLLNGDPREGPKLINCEIDWVNMGGASNCVFFNLSNNATLEFSQISALSIDNSGCGADIRFVFPDTQETITIPAYSPKTIVPVLSNQTQFYVYAIGKQPQDVTNFSILNYLPPMISVPASTEQNFASFGNISCNVSGNQTLIPATTSGTLEALSVTAGLTGGATSGSFIWNVQDGDGKVIAGGEMLTNNTSQQNQVLFSLSQLAVRFHNGLFLYWTSANLGATCGVSVNCYYRTP